ncbi:mitochondrial potassium channel ATP-binding subunit isoform X2 [Chelonia mydas]|uniref:mitochondrial potassium channel ATP-binding subunit isoform X2 n=1 Tax=Chelonia mydas TaxID=8469 RepID=UPI0018A2058A|nr:mitochondrial potassium channel ATP-binding subunit isoform X2 [Chelonia mydas]
MLLLLLRAGRGGCWARYVASHARVSGLLRAPGRLAAPSPALPHCPFSLGRATALLAGPALLGLGAGLARRGARCQEAGSPGPAPASPKPEPDFAWAEFWKFLRPQLLALSAAVVFALGVALLNIRIPMLLGELVNVVARCSQQRVGTYLREARRPALRLLLLYGLQGLLTFSYIVMLARVGERVAGSMRKALFASLLRLYCHEVDQSSRLNEKLGRGIAVFQGLSNLVLNGIVLGTIFVGGSLMAGEELSPGDLMSFMVASQTVQRSMANISILFGQVVRGLSAGARVFEFMTLEPTVSLSGGDQIPSHSLLGHICFRDVCFSYPTRPSCPVLRNFSLTLPPRKTVAIVGESGGGKSTVAALLERFYEPTGGAITLDGRELCTLDPSWLRGQVIGFISQEPALFGTTILENIRFGKPSASDAEVYAAARLANADSFVHSFPQGYGTIVGERGVMLSGGQKQRVAIARALLKNPSVLILDEATSALDAESEQVVQEALERAMAGRTVLVIAHRLSTIQGADLIVVLARGCVAEAGTHAELLRRSGLYAELIRRQAMEQP